MSSARSGHTATLLGDGRVLVAGGINNSSYVATAELYSPPPSDATPPHISCGTADGSWHNSDVQIGCTASDPESGLANAADASFVLTTSIPFG
jgi:hypothetical protein